MKTRLVILCLLLAVTAGAQEHNMARLTQSDTSYVDVSMGLSGETGRLKDVYDPDKLVAGTLDARSRRKLGRVNLFGHFGYGYSYATGSTWRGWIDPYETPFMLADSIAGNLSTERYRLQAGAGVPLAGGWSAGLDLAYDVALMAGEDGCLQLVEVAHCLDGDEVGPCACPHLRGEGVVCRVELEVAGGLEKPPGRPYVEGDEPP